MNTTIIRNIHLPPSTKPQSYPRYEVIIGEAPASRLARALCCNCKLYPCKERDGDRPSSAPKVDQTASRTAYLTAEGDLKGTLSRQPQTRPKGSTATQYGHGD